MSRWRLGVSDKLAESCFRYHCWEKLLYYFLCVFVPKEEMKPEPESYVTVTIDTKHKVRDHYNVYEKLGV